MTHVTQCIAVLCISLQDFLRRWSFRANLAEMEYDPEPRSSPNHAAASSTPTATLQCGGKHA